MGGCQELPSIPLIINKKPLKKHTKLMIVADAELHTLTEKMAKQKADDSKKDLKDAKKKPESQNVGGEGKAPKAAKVDAPKKGK